jgi:hypothetical protein
MATPFAAGIAALLLSYSRNNSSKLKLTCADDYREAFKSHTIPVKNLDLSNSKFYQGFGIIDAKKLFESLG